MVQFTQISFFFDGDPGISSAYLLSPFLDPADNPIVTLQSSTPIARLEYFFLLNSQGLGVSSNSLRVNFATPVPEPNPLTALLGLSMLLGTAKIRRRFSKHK